MVEVLTLAGRHPLRRFLDPVAWQGLAPFFKSKRRVCILMLSTAS